MNHGTVKTQTEPKKVNLLVSLKSKMLLISFNANAHAISFNFLFYDAQSINIWF